MINSIDFSGNIFKDYKQTELSKLSKVNLFIGQNNSGKSRLLRSIFQEGILKFMPDDFDLKLLDELKTKALEGVEELIEPNSDPITKGLYRKVIDFKRPFNFITTDFNSQKYVYDQLSLILKANAHHLSVKVPRNSNPQVARQSLIKKFNRAKEFLPKFENILDKGYEYEDFQVLYFPTLRGLRPMPKNQNEDLFKARTLQDYFAKDKDRLSENIYTGLTFYDELKRLLLGRHEERERVRIYEEFLSVEFFKSEPIHLIPNIDDDVVYIKIGEEQDRPVYRLGDGLQMIIILTYPLFFRKDKKLKVFIEEPELYLHPGMQRILLDTLTSKHSFPNHQFFISTHSNHFLDMTADFGNISVYSVQKRNKSKVFEISNLEHSSSDALNILGVKNSSVFLSNCTIWVEGITDRIYLRKYLELYFKFKNITNIKEDIHYSFVEYGGGNITHWSFLEDSDPEYPNINVDRLCGKIFLISDKDGAGLKKDGTPNPRRNKKTERHDKLKDRLGDRYYCLESREIENLLSPEILKDTIKQFKNEGNLIFNSWKWDNYKNVPIGKFIDNNVENLKVTFSEKSGTVKSKLLFAKRAISSMRSIEDLTIESIGLCENLYRFIDNENEV